MRGALRCRTRFEDVMEDFDEWEWDDDLWGM